jgi:hypothetical protein
MNRFPKTASFILILFIGVLIAGTGLALARTSGSLGLDVAKIHQLRKP